ncbi:DNA annealing helicase and endonuclease ZRANB3-like [Actinia tenebrosa]|uniref:DNA annealing helicase and endonuclease ZRANB3-like n=1 Tax=Actinia tenebrosa TaxID=6105 RepID=A0A6P8IJK4_ACTTE|nr:DNA annealing helicase and endonuclease ZRANB3-like [Actinia tenebrosa]
MADQLSQLQNLDFLPENLNVALLDFQRHGVRFGINNKGRCLIGDEMGLGKTLQAISIAYFYKDEWPLLIVVPSSMKYPWIEEIEKWITDLEPGDINLIRSGTDISNIPTSKISILGYGLCGDRRSSKLLVNAMKKQQFKVIILDESHYLKNRNAGRTKLLHPIAKSAKRVILLTGTPSLARPEELYIQLDIVRPGVFGTFSAFANRYCEAHYEDVGKFRKWNTRGARRLDELHYRLRNGMMIRRLKKNELFQFKAEFKKHHRTIEDKQASPKKKSEAFFELNRLSTVLYHYTGIAKAGSIQHYITDLLDGMENKFIVFCRHKQVIMAVIQLLSKKHVKYIHIDGSVPSSVRGTLVTQFQNDPLIRVAVLAIEAASFGLTLTAADHVVFAELHYTPGVMMQAEDRAHRIGQVNAVNVHYLVGKGTLDEVLWGMLRKKIYVTSSALDGKLDELHADEGDEEISKQLSACAAWLREESVDNDEDLQGYLFSQKPKKSRNKIEGHKDVRTYFTPPISTSKPSEISLLDSDEDMVDVPSSLPCTKKESVDNTTMSIDDSSEDGNDEYDEDELASMLVEENDSPNESETSSSKTAKAEKNLSSCDKNSKKGKIMEKITQVARVKNSIKDVNAHLYDYSEVVDSEEIFQSYIGDNDDNDDDDTDEGDDDDDDDLKAQNQSCQLSLSSSSSNLNSSSSPENSENDKKPSTSLKDRTNIDRSITTNRPDPEDKEFETTKDESLERSRKRNPFSLRNKGMSDKIFSSKLLESDSDDDDFVDPTPKSSQERKYEPVPNTCTQRDKEPVLSNSSTKSFVNAKQTLPLKKKKKKSKTRARTSDAAPWSCGACTFINDPQMIECSMCFTSKQPKKLVVNSEESIKTSADFNENDQKLFATKIEDKTSDYFSGNSTNTGTPEDTEASTNSVLCKDESSSMDLYQPSSKLEREEDERNDFKTKSSSVFKNNSPTNLCDDEDLDDFSGSFLQWSCSACTLLNDAMLNECSVCMTPRRRSQRKTKSRWSTWSCEKRRLERYEKSYKKQSNTQKAKEDHDSKMGISTAEEEHSEIGTCIDGKLTDRQEAAPPSKSTTKSRQRTRTRKKLNMGDQVERTLLVDEKSMSVDKGQICATADKVEGMGEEKCRQNDAEEGEQVCDRTIKSGEGHEETEENPFLLEFSDSDDTEDDRGSHVKESLCGTRTVHVGREGNNMFNGTQEQTMRGEEIIDTSDEKDGTSCDHGLGSKSVKLAEQQGREDNEDIHDGKESSSCENDLLKPHEDSQLIIAEQQKTRESIEDDEDIHDGKEWLSCENEPTEPHEDSKLTIAEQQKTRGEKTIEEDEDVHDGKERSSCENEPTEPHEDSKLTIAKQQKARGEKSIEDDEDIHDGKEWSSCENKPSEPREDYKLTKIAEQQTPRVDKNIDDDDKVIPTERKSISPCNNGQLTNSPGQDNSKNTADQKESEKEVVSKEQDNMTEQQRQEREGVNVERKNSKNTADKKESEKVVASKEEDNMIEQQSGDTEDDSLSNTKKPDEEESLQELQEAAKEIFGGDDDFDDLSMENDFVNDVVVRKPKDPPEPITLQFSLSLYTDRVYLYDENDHFLQSSFTMSDVKNNNKDDLPHILQHEYNYKQAKRIIQEWDRLGVQQKRTLSKSKLLFMNPFEAYRMARALRSEESSTNVRHPSKELRLQKVINAALEVGGQVKLVTRTPATKKRKRAPTENEGSTSNVRNPDEGTTSTSSKEFSCAQAFGPDGVPLCLYCKKPVDYGTLGNDWDSRFCSHDCKENYQIRISGTAVRRTLFEAEQGVCQLCHFNAHVCFQGVKSLPKKDRRAFLEKSVYSDLPPQLLNRMIVDPKEGMFWEADHIVAVVEGGGECGMENFRTLCVPCHKKVTRKLLQRLRTKRQRLDVTGSQTISTFLKSKS